MMPGMHRRHALAALSLPALALPACVGHALHLPPVPHVPHARAADRPRFALGVASGQPQPQGMVLWTRLTGEGLPDSVEVGWELAK